MSKTAHIIAIATNSLGDLGFGISAHPNEAQSIFDMAEVWAGPRPVLEVSENFVQPIPYIMVKKGEKYLAYTRSVKGGDDRLHNKASIGFGGHVDVTDAVVDEEGVILLKDTLVRAMQRELLEELGVTLTLKTVASLAKFTHVISSNANPVDRVHIGFCATLDITDENVLFEFEAPIENARWMTAEQLRQSNTELESWTDLVLQAS